MNQIYRVSAAKLFIVAPFLAVSIANADDDSLISAQVSFVSDYVFRGISQTLGDPAVQAGLDFAHPSGFFAGLWASNVDFVPADDPDDGADLEMDYLIGYWHEFGEHWSADVSLVHYAYPGTAPGMEYDYSELLLSAHYRWLSATIAYSNDVFAMKEEGTSYQLSGEYSFGTLVNVSASAGYYDLSDAYGTSYAFHQVGLSKALGPVTLELTYHDTNGNGEMLFGPDIAQGRTVLTISTSF